MVEVVYSRQHAGGLVTALMVSRHSVSYSKGGGSRLPQQSSQVDHI